MMELFLRCLIAFSGLQIVNGFTVPSMTGTPMSSRRPFGPSSRNHRPLWVSKVETTEDERISPPYVDRANVTLTFPSFIELMDCRFGESIVSDPFVCGNSTFCVKIYPRGGGHATSSSSTTVTGKPTEQGFGMAYKVLPMMEDKNSQKRNQRFGVYLQYLGEDTVDVTFALRLKGNQKVGPRFDVEWRAGMRFISPDSETILSKGCANDFGAHLMQTPLLQEFMGIPDNDWDDPTPLTANVELIIHDTKKELSDQLRAGAVEVSTKEQEQEKGEKTTSFFGLLGRDIRFPEGSDTKDVYHNGKEVRVGKIIVPILSRLSQRPKMFEQGAYPGVEYRILRIFDPRTRQERFTSCPNCIYEIRPIYPLVQQLERSWPIQISEADIPRLYTPNMYNVASAVGSLLTAITGLVTAFWVSQAISFFFIPSRSMDPTLLVGDVLLVEKVSPRLFHNTKKGDIVLFSPPEELRDIVAANGGRLTSRDLFVKRIAGQSGDKISVNSAGQVQVNERPAEGRRDLCEAEPLRLIERYVKAKEQVLAKDEYFLMGDCSSVSIDSRVWGPLQSSEIVGKPILRLWPLDRFGPLAPLQPLRTMETWQDEN